MGVTQRLLTRSEAAEAGLEGEDFNADVGVTCVDEALLDGATGALGFLFEVALSTSANLTLLLSF